MTNKDIDVLKAEYRRLQRRQGEQLSPDELASVSLRMGEILVQLHEAGADSYSGPSK